MNQKIPKPCRRRRELLIRPPEHSLNPGIGRIADTHGLDGGVSDSPTAQNAAESDSDPIFHQVGPQLVLPSLPQWWSKTRQFTAAVKVVPGRIVLGKRDKRFILQLGQRDNLPLGQRVILPKQYGGGILYNKAMLIGFI